MYKYKFAKVVDYIFFGLVFFVIFYGWTNFYQKNIVLSFFVAIVCSFFLLIIINFFISKKSEKEKLTQKQKEVILNYSTQLKFSDRKKVLTYFKDISTNSKIKKNYILKENCIIYPYFNTENFTLNDLTRTYGEIEAEKINDIYILSSKFDADCYNIAKQIKNKNIQLFDAQKTYNEFIKNNALPENVVDTKPQKLSFKELLLFMISPKRTKNYLIFGIILLFSSFFVMFKIYYLITGSILLILALLSRIIKQNK
ncbi:MAG: hypothetical protein IJ837_00025 [Clostridia bacterium]|nr:hypothetical protein [Clostridia bacterium]